MRFQVPQFIEIEDKIFGPLTLKQFIYVVGGAGIIFLLYVLLPFWLMVIPAVLVAAFALALAFYKVNNRSFIKVVESALRFHSSSKLYLWKKGEKEIKKKVEEIKKTPARIYVPKLTQSKLKELSWSLDIKRK
jgi:hypothetical protein